MDRIGCIGTGVMGSAIARAVRKRVDAKELFLANVPAEAAQDLAEELDCQWADNQTVAKTCRYIYLAVKPQVMPRVLEDLAPVFQERTDPFVLITMAAGISIQRLQQMAGGNYPVIRMMPNVAATVGEAVILCSFGEGVKKEDKERFLFLTGEAGLCDPVEEKLMDAAGSLTGCGPAFAFMMMQALADGAVACGVDRARARSYAAQTLLGAAKLALESGKHFELLKDEVCSPGGSTIEGVKALEDGGVRGALMQAVAASYEKNKKLGQA